MFGISELLLDTRLHAGSLMSHNNCGQLRMGIPQTERNGKTQLHVVYYAL